MQKNKEHLEMLGNDKHFLLNKKKPESMLLKDKLRAVDLFSGCGGISLGFSLAAQDLDYGFDVRLAADFDQYALECFRDNFEPKLSFQDDVSSLFESGFSKQPLSDAEKKLKKEVGSVDVLLGGPPCQGHSDLNNYTRRSDPKNELMSVMVRAAYVFERNAIVIENVVGALNDKKGVVKAVQSSLEELGYQVDIGIVDFSQLGVPQSRKRMFLIANKGKKVCIDDISKQFYCPERTIEWAIQDLMGSDRTLLIDKVSGSQPQTKKRIDYLFDNGLHDLPNEQRPACHRDKKHSYNSVYGRLKWSEQCQTITSGFYCMCMGRYVHPEERRTLTAHEAARLQFFPDFFDFSSAKTRTKLAQIIGNAVPPKGAYAIARVLIPAIKRFNS